MLPETISSLFNLADNFTLELMAVLALIWLGTLGYVIVRKVSGLIQGVRTARVVASEPYGKLAEAVAKP
jgi:hypothetical protein